MIRFGLILTALAVPILIADEAQARCVRGAAGCGAGFHGAGAGARGVGVAPHHGVGVGAAGAGPHGRPTNRNGGMNRLGPRR